MSKIASTRRLPPSISPSTATSVPGMYSSTSSSVESRLAQHLNLWRFHQQSNPLAPQPQIRPHRSPASRPGSPKATAASPRTEISAAPALRQNHPPAENEKKSGTRTPAARNTSRCRNLFRQISAAAGEFPAIPKPQPHTPQSPSGRSPRAPSIAPSTAILSRRLLVDLRSLDDLLRRLPRLLEMQRQRIIAPRIIKLDGTGPSQTPLPRPASPPPQQTRASDTQLARQKSARRFFAAIAVRVISLILHSLSIQSVRNSSILH